MNPLNPEIARHEIARRVRAADDHRLRRLARAHLGPGPRAPRAGAPEIRGAWR